MNHFSIAIRIGLIWGIGSIIYSLCQYLITGNQETGIILGLLVLIAGFAVLYLIGIKRRNQLGGYIRWKEAMTHMWVGGIINSILYTMFIFILNTYIDPELKQKTIETQIEYIEKFRGSMGDAVADQQIEKLENSDPFSPLNMIMIFAGGLLIQFVFSSLVALIVKRDNPNENQGYNKKLTDNF